MFGGAEGPAPAFGAPDPTLGANGDGPGLAATVGRVNEGAWRDARLAGGCGIAGRIVDCTVTGGNTCGFAASTTGANWAWAGAECRKLDATTTPSPHSRQHQPTTLPHSAAGSDEPEA
jgi:hypothetical protein